MADPIMRAPEWKKKADKDINGWWMFSSTKHDFSPQLYHDTANSFKLAKSWDQAGSVYIQLAEYHLKLDNKHEAASVYVDAANCYKKITLRQAISCLEQAVGLFSDIGRFDMAARYCKVIGELYDQERNFEEAMAYFQRAAEFSQGEEASSSAVNQCMQKVAQFSAQLEQYPKAIEIFEEIARQSVKSNLLRYGVRGLLLNAGICYLCKGHSTAITNALVQFKELDSSFSRTRECQLLSDLAAAYTEGDVAMFTEVLKDYDSLSPLDAWRTTLLLRVKEALNTQPHQH